MSETTSSAPQELDARLARLEADLRSLSQRVDQSEELHQRAKARAVYSRLLFLGLLVAFYFYLRSGALGS
ncbi:MAG: hypothetical protein MK135_00545 [Polyangiaceae bacterium]|nr:hypothetical protein [Polyangiaceae bacterium]